MAKCAHITKIFCPYPQKNGWGGTAGSQYVLRFSAVANGIQQLNATSYHDRPYNHPNPGGRILDTQNSIHQRNPHALVQSTAQHCFHLSVSLNPQMLRTPSSIPPITHTCMHILPTPEMQFRDVICKKLYRPGPERGAVGPKGRRSRVSLFLLLQAVDAINATLTGQLAPTADGLVGGGAATGAGGKVHLAFGVLVHQTVGVDWISGCGRESGFVRREGGFVGGKGTEEGNGRWCGRLTVSKSLRIPWGCLGRIVRRMILEGRSRWRRWLGLGKPWCRGEMG